MNRGDSQHPPKKVPSEEVWSPSESGELQITLGDGVSSALYIQLYSTNTPVDGAVTTSLLRKANNINEKSQAL